MKIYLIINQFFRELEYLFFAGLLKIILALKKLRLCAWHKKLRASYECAGRILKAIALSCFGSKLAKNHISENLDPNTIFGGDGHWQDSTLEEQKK